MKEADGNDQREDKVTLWTAQADRVWETAARDGVYYVKKEYITQKYQDTAWIFETAYQFFREEGGKQVKRPLEAQSPVWMYRDPKWAVPAKGYPRKKLEIPRDQILLFDLRIWNRILNLSYVGTEAEIEAFEQECSRQGVRDPMEIMKSSFYPLLKQKIYKSWKHLFTDPLPEEMYCQGAAWMIRQEWIIETDES